MECFTVKELDNPSFPAITRKFRELKTTEGGAAAVCEIMEKYMKESREEGREEGRREGIEEGRKKTVINLYSKGMSTEDISKWLDVPPQYVGSVIADFKNN